MKKAIDLYQGPLFGSARDEHWIMSKVVAFEYRYLGAVCELMKTLDLGRDYVCIQHYASKMLLIAPHSIDGYYWMIYAMFQLDHPEMARGELRRADRKIESCRFFSVLWHNTGVTPVKTIITPDFFHNTIITPS